MGGLWEVLYQDLPSRSSFIQRLSQRFREVLTFFALSVIFLLSLVSLADNCINIHSCYLTRCLGLSLGQTWTFVRGNSHFPACKPPVLCLLHISAYIFTSYIIHLPSKLPIPLSNKPSCMEYQAFRMPL